jgi:urease accessory protein
MPSSTDLQLLRLLQLADSALPVGALVHSYGLEALIEEGYLTLPDLFHHLRATLSENLLFEAVFCRRAHELASQGEDITELDQHFSAFRLARESREASLLLGKRFVALVSALEPELGARLKNTHFALAFGYACGLLGFSMADTVGAFLHQSISGTVSVCQRILKLGQREAAQIIWDLKPDILETVNRTARYSTDDVGCFAHLPELASMRHPILTTRLFVS